MSSQFCVFKSRILFSKKKKVPNTEIYEWGTLRCCSSCFIEAILSSGTNNRNSVPSFNAHVAAVIMQENYARLTLSVLINYAR